MDDEDETRNEKKKEEGTVIPLTKIKRPSTITLSSIHLKNQLKQNGRARASGVIGILIFY